MARRNALELNRPVFVDTAAWIGLVVEGDALRQEALATFARLGAERASLVTSELVLIEFGNALATPAQRSFGYRFVANLRASTGTRIVPAEDGLLVEAWDLHGRRPDKSWSLVDCSSFIVIAREGIGRAFTSDRHFEQAGFQRLMTGNT